MVMVIVLSAVLRRRTNEVLSERRRQVDIVPADGTSVDCPAADWEWVDLNWDELRVGDVIQVRERQRFPADVVLLSTSEPAGAAYIETANLDGETSLKMRQCTGATLRHIGALTPTFLLAGSGAAGACGSVSETDAPPPAQMQRRDSRIETSALRIHPAYTTGVLAPHVLASRLLGHAAALPSASSSSRPASRLLGGSHAHDTPDARSSFAAGGASTECECTALIECEAPNPNLYSFSGNIRLPVPVPVPMPVARDATDANTEADADAHQVQVGTELRPSLKLSEAIVVDNEQLVQRGTTLRNTRVVLALVAYTGAETKIVLNSDMPRLKRSSLDHLVNQMVRHIRVR